MGADACVNFTTLPLKHFTSIAYCEGDGPVNSSSKIACNIQCIELATVVK